MSHPHSPRLNNPLERLAGYQLRRASVAVSSDLAERLESLGLTVVSLSLVLLIEANPGVTQSQLGRLLAIKRANMAPMTAQLLKRSLVARHAADGRSQGLLLTDDGKALARQGWAAVGESERKFFGKLSAREAEHIAQTFRAVWASSAREVESAATQEL